MAERINAMLGLPAPVRGTGANGWFGGYGCRWCDASRAWFTVLPFEAEAVSSSIAELFKDGGVREVTITNEGGVSRADGGRGLQVSAFL